jgi:hypothetical protein
MQTPPASFNPLRLIARGFGLLAILGAACSDPYSQRRIQMRMERLNSAVTTFEKRETDGQRRTNEAVQTIQQWWKADCDHFNRIAPTVGDYFW